MTAATVWNFAIYAPLAVDSDRTAFLMQGDGATESEADTNATWQVDEERGQGFILRVGNGFMFYWAADPGEQLDGRLYDWNWKDAGSSISSHWVRYLHEVNKARFTLSLPEGLTGIFIWSGQQYRLHSGEKELLLAAASQ